MKVNANHEYRLLNGLWNKKVPGTEEITCQANEDETRFDVDFIKTPFGETDLQDPTKPFGLILACEGYSLDNSINEFWTTALTNKVKTIISLNEEFDHESRHWGAVHTYFPTEVGKAVSKGNFTLTMNVKPTEEKHMIIRHFNVTDHKKLNGNVTHIHFKSWPDFGVPSANALQSLQKIVNTVVGKLVTQIDRL